MKRIIASAIFLVSSLLCLGQKATDEALAHQYFQSGDYGKALNIYQKLFNTGKNQQQYYDAYFNTLLKLRDYDAAEKLAKKMMGNYKGTYIYQIDFGRVLRERGDQAKASSWYEELIKSLPKQEFAVRELSSSFYRADAYDFSVKTLLAGRKLLNDEMLFSFDLLALYRYQKNKILLIQEYLHLLSREENMQLTLQAKAAFATLLETAEDYNLLKMALLKRLQKDPQNLAYSDILAWQYIQQKQYDLALRQIIALDKRQRGEGDSVYELASVFIANKAFAQAIEGLEYLISKGPSNPHYITSKMQILHAKNQQLTSGKLNVNELKTLESEYSALLSEFGKNQNTVFAMRQLAGLYAYYLQKPDKAELLLEEALKIPRLQPLVIAQIKLELGDLYVLNANRWEATLTYGQVEKDFSDEPPGQEAKFRNARLSYYQGDFTWAKAQLDVLKSSTSQLIANDALNLSLLISENTETENDSSALAVYARTDFLLFTNRLDKALSTLDSIAVRFPKNSLSDDILISKAKINHKQGNFNKALEYLQSIVSNHSSELWGDDALFMMAEIYENDLQEPTKAMEYYERIISDYPESLYLAEARKRFRNLRGDAVG